MEESATKHQLNPASLGVADIVFFVIAAAAPLGATLGAAPVVFATGGAGAPGLYLIASVILLLFAVGFAAMSKYVVSAGGFAELVRCGMGKHAGYAAGGIALLAYVSMLAGLYGQFAAFGADVVKSFLGYSIDWQLVAFFAIVVVGIFGYLDVNLSAKILGVLMIFEVLILVIFDIAVMLQVPYSGINLVGFRLQDIVSPGMWSALMFAFACFVGFESTTIYGEEAKNPQKAVPLATYIAILIIGVFYTMTTWCLALAYSGKNVQAIASADMLNFVFAANTKFVGEWSTHLMQFLVVTSVFAVLLSFHNALCRYFFALARSEFLPSALRKIHSRHNSPYVASVFLSCLTAVIIGLFIFFKADPTQQLYMWMVALGTLGILVLQALGAFSVVGYFSKNKVATIWHGKAAPILGGIGLSIVVVLAFVNFSDLSGAKEGVATLLPWLVIAAAVVGIVNGEIRSRKKVQKIVSIVEASK